MMNTDIVCKDLYNEKRNAFFRNKSQDKTLSFLQDKDWIIIQGTNVSHFGICSKIFHLSGDFWKRNAKETFSKSSDIKF